MAELNSFMNTAYLLTGGNMGDRRHNLHQAFEQVSQKAGKVIKHSAVYETAAWGNTNQAPFLNQVLKVITALTPLQLLHTLLSIEERLGRKRLEKLGPRTIDIDILFFNEEVVATKELSVPHPQIQNRRFVLEPLAEIAPELVHPVLHKTMNELLEACPDKLEVKMFVRSD